MVILLSAGDLKVKYHNDAFRESLPEALTNVNINGMSLNELLPNGREHPCVQLFRRVSEGGEKVDLKAHESVSWKGDRIFLDWTALPVKNGTDTADVLVMIRDVSERRRVEETLRWQQRKEELLADVAGRLLATSDPQSLIEELAQRTMHFLDCDVFFNYLVDQERGCLHLNACSGIPSSEVKKIQWLEYGAAVCGCVAQEGRRMIVENVSEAEDQRTYLVRSYGVQAYASHPLTVEGRPIGTLSFGTRSRTKFTGEELSVMKTVADHIAIAMSRLIASNALSESEAKYRGLFENMTEGFYLSEVILDESGRACDLHVLEANPGFMRSTGLPNPVGKTIGEILPEVEQIWFDNYGRVALTGEPMHFENYNSGTGRWYDVHAFCPERGKVAAIFTDSTDRKRSEEALKKGAETARQRAEEVETIMDTVPAAIWVAHDPECRVITGNQAADQFYEAARDENVSAGPSSGEEWDTTRRFFQDGRELRPEELPMQISASQGIEVSNSELEVLLPSGQRITMLGNARPLFDEGGRARGSVASFLNITDRKRMEEELRRSNAELQQFAYVASHDLQEPLRMVTAYLSLLNRDCRDKLDGQGREYIRYAVEGGLRAKALVQDLLEFSRVDSQGAPFQEANMEEVLGTVVDNLISHIRDEDATITHDRLPQIVADETQMVQVLQNLISNAIKFHGPRSPVVHVSFKENDTSWQFSVRDNGIGIDPRYKDRLFILFQRLHTQDEYPGTGLGLAISKKIVERHGGRIWFESQPGKGTTFYFTISKELKK